MKVVIAVSIIIVGPPITQAPGPAAQWQVEGFPTGHPSWQCQVHHRGSPPGFTLPKDFAG
jgi:hypothetical protein